MLNQDISETRLARRKGPGGTDKYLDKRIPIH